MKGLKKDKGYVENERFHERPNLSTIGLEEGSASQVHGTEKIYNKIIEKTSPNKGNAPHIDTRNTQNMKLTKSEK